MRVFKKQLPGNLNSTIEQNIKLIKNKKDYVNIWNNEESDYYNKGHESNEKIKKFAYNAINNLWIRHESQNKSVFYELKNKYKRSFRGWLNSLEHFHCMNR